MKKVSRKFLSVLACLALGFSSFSIVSCSDNGDDDKTEKPNNGGKTDDTKVTEAPEPPATKPSHSESAKIETYTGAFVIAQDAYKTLKIVDDGFYEMTDALESGVEDDWGTWILVSGESSAARVSATAATKQYKFKSATHKTKDGKAGSFAVETNSAGALLGEDKDSTSKVTVDGVGLDNAEKIYKTSTPVKIDKDNLNLTETEQKEIFTVEAIEKGGEKAGVKFTFKAPTSLAEKTPRALTLYYIDKAGNSSTRGDYHFSDTEKDKATLYFPFVDEDSLITLKLLIEYDGVGVTYDQFIAYYILNTKSGLGTIGILQKNYTNWEQCSDSRIVINDKGLTVNNIAASSIIPTSIETTNRSASLGLFYTKSKEPVERWEKQFWSWGAWPTVDKFTDTYTFTSYPKPNKKDAKGFGYYFYEFMYSYKVEGYPECDYSTPSIISAIYEVPNIENELDGRTLVDNSDACWNFKGKTITKNISEDNSKVTEVYDYTLDDEKPLLTLNLKSFSRTVDGKTYSYSSLAEAKTVMENSGIKGDSLDYNLDFIASKYATPQILYYQILNYSNEEQIFYTLTYFDGNLPTVQEFCGEDDVPVNLIEGRLRIYNKDTNGRTDNKFECFPTFKDGKFSGNLYKTADDGAITKLGTLEGTYKVTEEAYSSDFPEDYITSDKNMTGGRYSITFTFTKLPAGVSGVELNKAYKQTRGH